MVRIAMCIGALEGTRTPDLLVRSQSLYPAELQARILTECTMELQSPYANYDIIHHDRKKVKPFLGKN